MNETRLKFLFFFGWIFLFTIVTEIWPATIVFGFVLLVGYFSTSKEGNDEWYDEITHNDQGYHILTYEGDELNYSDSTLSKILNKHFPFFVSLNDPGKNKFISRLKEFISAKTFKIHDDSGFKEMPVLISATAIQVSFGLQSYLLPNFQYIHIYPEEFISTEPAIRYLEGNVSGNSINISWKHFLEGFLYPDDGLNVGLHEMAHALYYQNFIAEENTDESFKNVFSKFDPTANKVFEKEKAPGNDLYSDYALSNFQEFWAESVEIFFEKPVILKNTYPDLYTTICAILNQSPAEIL